MKKDYASPAVLTGCPRCPRVFGTFRCGISLYPVGQLRLIILFCNYLMTFLLLLFNNFDICLHFSGSHDTMSYCLDERSSVLKSLPWVVQVLDTFFPCIVRPCIIKWATTQVWQTVMMRYYVVLKLYEFIYLSSVTNSFNHFHYIV